MNLKVTRYELEIARETPWSDNASYKAVAIGGCPTSTITVADVARVMGHDAGADGSDFASSKVAVVQLLDGRYVGWESWVSEGLHREPPASGFHVVQRGGDVEVWFARTLPELRASFSEQAWGVMRL